MTALTVQNRWMALIELLNSDPFDGPCTWFEDHDGHQLPLMANRTGSAQNIPVEAHRLRIEGRIWVRGDDWIEQDVQNIFRRLSDRPEYTLRMEGEDLYIELAPLPGT